MKKILLGLIMLAIFLSVSASILTDKHFKQATENLRLLLSNNSDYAELSEKHLKPAVENLAKIPQMKNSLRNDSQVRIDVQMLDESDEWVNSSLIIANYNSSNKLTSAVYHLLFPFQEEILEVPFMKLENIYNNQNNIESLRHYFGTYEGFPDPENVIWLEFMNHNASFNNNNNIVYAYQSISADFKRNNQFDIIGYNYYLYNNNQLSSIIAKELDDEEGDVWEFNKIDFSYFNNKVSTILNFVSADSLEWELDSKVEVEYHHADNTAYQVFQDYINNSGIVVIQQLYPSLLLPGLITQMEFSHFDYEEWFLDEKVDASYDNYLNLIETISSYYDDNYDEWTYSEKVNYYYNNNNDIGALIISFYEENWLQEMRYVFDDFVSESSLTIKPQALDFSNYPNPFKDELNIEIKSSTHSQHQIKIYDIRGRLIDEVSSVKSNNLNISTKDLPSGIYLIKISNDESSVAKKVLKIK